MNPTLSPRRRPPAIGFARIVPYPLLSAILLAVWLLLMNSASVGQILLGGALGLLLPPLLAPFRPLAPPVRKPWTLLRLLLLVQWDIVVASLQVARQVLRPVRELQPAFVVLPLDLEHDLTIAMLASMISLTPGTVSADVTPDRRALLIHTLSVEDGDELVRTIKARYEAPLLEAFGC